MNAEEIIQFLKLIGKSKRIKRAGWVREGVEDPESVAEHCFRLIVLAMVLAPKLRLDQNKLIKMAIIHDLGEVKTGDLVVERGKVVDPKARRRKEELERAFIEEKLRSFEISHKYKYSDLFDEMVKRETKEAKIFWQLDKLEMAIQALEYEEEQGKDLTEFFINAERIINDPFFKEIMEEIRSQRKKN